MSKFLVLFSDGEKLIIKDIINFEQAQIYEIKGIAADFTKFQLRKVEKYGKDITYLTELQKQVVLNTKNRIVSGKTSAKLLDEEIIQVTLHTNERSLKRIGSDNQTTIISLVDKVKRTDIVVKAQFKGYSALSYTMMENNDPAEFKLPISFVWGFNKRRRIKMITVAPQNTEIEVMETSIAEINPVMAEMLEKIKGRLKKD